MAASRCVLPRPGRPNAKTFSARSTNPPSHSAGTCRRTFGGNFSVLSEPIVLSSGKPDPLLSRRAALAPLGDLAFDQPPEILRMGPAVPLRLPGQFLVGGDERGQLEEPQEHRQGPLGGIGALHTHAPASPASKR